MRAQERLQNIFHYVSRWRFVGIMAWTLIPSLFLLHLESLITFLALLTIFFTIMNFFYDGTKRTFAGSLFATYSIWWLGIINTLASVLKETPFCWPSFFGNIIVLICHVSLIYPVFRVAGAGSRNQHLLGLGAFGLIYLWVFCFSGDNTYFHTHYPLYIAVATFYTIAVHLFAELHEDYVYSFPNCRQVRLARVRQAIPLLMRSSVLGSALLVFASVVSAIFAVLGGQGEGSMLLEWPVFRDLLYKQLVATMILKYSIHVHRVVATERLDFLSLLKDHHGTDATLSEASCAHIIAEHLKAQAPHEPPLMLFDYHLWNSFETLTQSNSTSCSYFFSSIDTWRRVKQPCFDAILQFCAELSQTPRQQYDQSTWNVSLLLGAKSKWQDLQIVVWAIGCVTRIMVISKEHDKHGTLQLHDELAVLMDLLTHAYLLTADHLEASKEERNYTAVHIVQAELTQSIYMLRNTFSSAMDKYNFANAHILQKFADYQIL